MSLNTQSDLGKIKGTQECLFKHICNAKIYCFAPQCLQYTDSFAIFCPQAWQYIHSPDSSTDGSVVAASLTVRMTVLKFSLFVSSITPVILGANFAIAGITNPNIVKKSVITAHIPPITVNAIAPLCGTRASASFSRNGPACTRELIPTAKNTIAKTIVKHHTIRMFLTIFFKSFLFCSIFITFLLFSNHNTYKNSLQYTYATSHLTFILFCPLRQRCNSLVRTRFPSAQDLVFAKKILLADLF